MKRTVRIAALLSVIGVSLLAQPKLIRVPQDYAKIQLAINAAVNGDTVLVDEGTYFENICITKKIVVASLFVNDGVQSHISQTIIDGSMPTNVDSSSVVTFKGIVDTTAAIIGFSITGGKGNKSYIAEQNIYGMAGGGINVFADGGARISNNIIRNNFLTNTGGMVYGWGGGIAASATSYTSTGNYVIIEGNIIINNAASGTYGESGAIDMMSNGRVRRNTIMRNNATVVGGGFSFVGGSVVTIEQNYIAGNSAQYGGALHANYYSYSAKQPSLTIINNIISANVATVGGLAFRFAGCDVRLINNSIVQHYNGSNRTIRTVPVTAGYNSISMLNNIIWNPLTPGEYNFEGALVYASYNCVRGGITGTNNINVDPLFVASDSLYHLAVTSPVIGAGVTSATVGGVLLTAPSTDYSSAARPNPSWSKPDLGATESPYAISGINNVIRVPQDQTTIQKGIDSAKNGDLVLVSEGTYKENLLLKKKITVASLFYQDKDTSHISKTILDGGTPLNADSASVILVLVGTDTNTVIKGFTIQNGRGTKFPPYIFGGGISIIGGGATISNNIIRNNTCTSSTGPVGAAGIDIEADASNIGPAPWAITNNTIINNSSTSTASSTSGTVDGGGLGLTGYGKVLNNVIMKNSATGSYYGAGGGAAVYGWINGVDIDFSNNLVVSNSSSSYGGGLAMWVNTPYRPKVSFTNNIIAKNTASTGSALHVISGDYTFVNNTIVGNTGTQTMQLLASRGALAFRLMNNIFWNTGSTSEFNATTYVSASYNCVRGGLTGTGNINTDPLFVANDSLYRLTAGSACISAGMMSASVGGVTLNAPAFDYLGMARPRPVSSKPDMGAIEHDSETVTSVKELNLNIPTEFTLSQNYPNPFNPSTTIRYALPSSAHVRLTVYNLLGQVVSELVNDEQSAGWKEVQWNAKDVSSGIFFYKLQALQKDGGRAGSFIETKKCLMIK